MAAIPGRKANGSPTFTSAYCLESSQATRQAGETEIGPSGLPGCRNRAENSGERGQLKSAGQSTPEETAIQKGESSRSLQRVTLVFSRVLIGAGQPPKGRKRATGSSRTIAGADAGPGRV